MTVVLCLTTATPSGKRRADALIFRHRAFIGGRFVDAASGSTAVRKIFMTYSGQSNLKPVWPETGGKSPNLIFADCEDLDRAADMAAFGIFFNHGEVCSANSRRHSAA
jgi:hypothetical protein